MNNKIISFSLQDPTACTIDTAFYAICKGIAIVLAFVAYNSFLTALFGLIPSIGNLYLITGTRTAEGRKRPYSPDSLWTLKERSRIITSNKKSIKKEA